MSTMMAMKPDRIVVQNVTHPGRERSVDAAMYTAMKRAYLAVLPRRSPGLTIAELAPRLRERLPESLYPGGARAGWWAKLVQLDLEARGIIVREKTRPLRLRRV